MLACLLTQFLYISRATVVNLLGGKVDINLKWDNHIDYVRSKISKCIGILHKLIFFVPQSVLFTLYNSLILPSCTWNTFGLRKFYG